MKNNLKIEIKQADASEIDKFYDFFEWSIKNQFPEYSEKVKEYFVKKGYSKISLEAHLRKKEKILLLALSRDETVGYLLGSPPWGGIAFINWLGVKNSFHNNGIGTSLLKKFEKIVKEQNAHKIHVWTDKRNLQFYKRKGYKLVGSISSNFFGADDWLFYKEIRKSCY